MSLTLEGFDEFFTALHGKGRTPYRWQRELLARLLETGRWPQELDIPTGGGKSTAIEIHVFANAVAQQRVEDGVENAPRIPRRLSMIVARRAVVDDHLERARGVMSRVDAAEDGILLQVRELLLRRSYPAGFPEEERQALRVHLLRGGSAAVGRDGSLGHNRDAWIHHPAAVQVLCGTPDMLGSRLLHRGYGVAPRARPRSAGLLGYDHVAVLDEAHLSIQLLDTFRRVEEMCSRWNPVAEVVPTLQVCAATATHHGQAGWTDSDEERLGLDWSNLDPTLQPILTHPKPVDYVELPGWNTGTKKAMEDHAEIVLAQVIALREQTTGTLGVVVNRVRTAVHIQELASRVGLSTKLLVGPQRFGESRDLRLEDVDLVVATQTIEVGVDVDFAAMVTDLAPGPSLVQRAGRVNRRGLREEGRVVVVGPDGEGPVPPPESRPYIGADLRAARDWVRDLSHRPGGLSPHSVRQSMVPPATPDRQVFSHLDAADARLLGRTSEHLFAEPDLSFWLRDSLDSDEQEVRVIGRRMMPLLESLEAQQQGEIADATYQLLQHLEYEDQEIFPSTPARVRSVLTRKGLDPKHQAWVRRDDQWTLLRPRTNDGLPHAQWAGGFLLRGGDLVVLDADLPCTVGVPQDPMDQEQGTGTVFLPEGTRPLGDHSRPFELGMCTYQYGITDERDPVADSQTLVCRAAGEAEPDEDGQISVDDLPLVDFPVDQNQQITVHPGPSTEVTDGHPAWVVCVVRREASQDEPIPEDASSEPVLLKDHQRDVGNRAGAFGKLLHLDQALCDVLGCAGEFHDTGKSAPAFQVKLRAEGKRSPQGLSTGEQDLLYTQQQGVEFAKSSGILREAQRHGQTAPRGWRHEMLSAARYWADTVQNRRVLPERPGPEELTLWLIGTHHGLGRNGFTTGESQVLSAVSAEEGNDVREAVRLLYSEGLWEDLAALMERVYGPWATSYLEALLRAADATISQEGR